MGGDTGQCHRAAVPARLGPLRGQQGHPGVRLRSPETEVGAGKAVAVSIVLLLIENSFFLC